MVLGIELLTRKSVGMGFGLPGDAEEALVGIVLVTHGHPMQDYSKERQEKSYGDEVCTT